MRTTSYVWLFGAAFATSAVLVEAVRRWTLRRGILDNPNARSSHAAPVPRGGGIAIVVVTLAAMSFLHWRYSLLPRPAFLTIFACAAAIACISWLDDLHSVPSAARFAAHLAGAAATVIATYSWSAWLLPEARGGYLGAVCAGVTILWIAGLTNAYNFMDGIDGIAGAQAVVAGLSWALLSATTGLKSEGVIGILLAGSAAGFLLYNWQPARIFMGDVGSAFLGYMFAVLPVLAARHDQRAAIAGALLVWPFVFDTSFTFVRRTFRRERVFSAHRSHLYQRLQQTGVSHATTTLIYAVLALMGTLAAFAVCTETGTIPAILAIGLAAASLVGFVLLREGRMRGRPTAV